MRTVFDNGMTIHTWAQCNQAYGRNSNDTIRFHGPELLTYRESLAFIDPHGRAWLADNFAWGNSPTSSAHRSRAWRAAEHRDPIFVPNLYDLARAFRTLCHAAGMEGVSRYHRYDYGHEDDPNGMKQARKDVREWAGAWIIAERSDYWNKGATWESAVRAVLALFGMERSANKIKREAEKRAAHHAERTAREAKERQRKNTGLVLKRYSVELIKRRTREILDNSRSADEAIGVLKGWDREILRALKFANANGYGKRSVSKIRNLRQQIRLETLAIRSRFERAQHRAEARKAITIVRAVRAFEDGRRPFNVESCREVFRHSLDRLECRSISADGEDTELALMYGHHAILAMVGNPYLTRVRAKLETWRGDAGNRDVADLAAIRHEREAEYRRRAAADRKAAEDKHFEAWFQGEPGGMPYGRTRDSLGGAYVRAKNVQRDHAGTIIGGTVQTSQGAEVPLTHAIRLYRAAVACRQRGDTFRPNGSRMSVGSFRVDVIETNGNIRVGCHSLTFPTIHALAVSIGVGTPLHDAFLNDAELDCFTFSRNRFAGRV